MRAKKRAKTVTMALAEARALRAVAWRAVAVSNEIAIEVEEPHWTAKERALMRAIERLEDITLGGGTDR